MALNIGARRSSLPKVISNYPSWNWTPGCSSPVPYPVTYDLKESVNISPDVYYNGDNAFIMKSDSNKVRGDEAGKNGGVLSGTTSAEAEPIEHSDSVFVNGSQTIRCGDLFWMNHKNTQGTLVCAPPPPKGAITDSGKAPDAEPAPEMPSFTEFF